MLYENTLLQKKDQKSQFAEYIEICIFKYCDVTYTTTVNEIMRESVMKIMNYEWLVFRLRPVWDHTLRLARY